MIQEDVKEFAESMEKRERRKSGAQSSSEAESDHEEEEEEEEVPGKRKRAVSDHLYAMVREVSNGLSGCDRPMLGIALRRFCRTRAIRSDQSITVWGGVLSLFLPYLAKSMHFQNTYAVLLYQQCEISIP